jgi:SH3 domain-containing YSC84-like protein 1
MKTIGSIVIGVLLMPSAAFAKSDSREEQDNRLQNAGVVMSEILNMPDTIPRHTLDRTKCIVVIPSVVKAAFVVGASYGRGAMVCRTGTDFIGPWGGVLRLTAFRTALT